MTLIETFKIIIILISNQFKEVCKPGLLRLFANGREELEPKNSHNFHYENGFLI